MQQAMHCLMLASSDTIQSSLVSSQRPDLTSLSLLLPALLTSLLFGNPSLNGFLRSELCLPLSVISKTYCCHILKPLRHNLPVLEIPENCLLQRLLPYKPYSHSHKEI